MSDYEKLGVFYLGREYNLASGQLSDTPVLYDSKDLTTHALCVGMTGSGKTGLCLSLLEEAAIDGLPAICIDPKGDLGNLLLTFPSLKPADFKPWIDPGEATRKGLTVDELAARTATQWKEGLAAWDQPPERISRFRESADVCIYTPGSTVGVPLTILKSLSAPPPSFAIMPRPFAKGLAVLFRDCWHSWESMPIHSAAENIFFFRHSSNGRGATDRILSWAG